MSDVKISALPSVTTILSATDVLPIVTGGITSRVTPKVIVETALTTGITVPSWITTNSGNPALKLTQAGAGNSLLVQDTVNDTSPFVVNTDGKVGIGISSPTALLHVAGNGLISTNSASTALQITQIGTGAALLVEDSASPDSSPFVVKADGKVGIGTLTPTAALQVTSDILINDIRLGSGGNASISNNMFVGYNALKSNTIGIENTAIGANCLGLATTGSSNTACGTSALGQIVTGNYNSAFGDQSFAQTTGNNNTGIGYFTGFAVTTGSGNTFIGNDAGSQVTTGSNNVIIGGNNGSGIATSSNNIILSDGAGNTKLYYASASSLWSMTGNLTVTGSGIISTNSATTALQITQTGTGNAFVVEDSSPDSTPFVIDSTGNVGIGLTTPTAALHVVSSVKIDTTTNNQSYTTTGAGTITISSGTTGSINNMAIGSITPKSGTFTTINCDSTDNASCLARNGGLSAVISIPGSTTYATGGITLPIQIAQLGSAWRIKAYGNFVAHSSANNRNLIVACYWGSTQIGIIGPSTGALVNTTQTTNWNVEFDIAGTSTTAVWVTGQFQQNIGTASGNALLTYNAVPASTTVTAGPQTLDFRVAEGGTIDSLDIINVHQVVIERLK